MRCVSGTRVCLLLGLAAISATPSGAGPFSAISESEKLTAVSSKAFNGYARSRLADGSFQPEAYAFGEGGPVTPPLMVVRDPTIDDVSFNEIARTISVPLAGQNYLPTHDPVEAKLLIMVFWGRTTGSVNSLDGPSVDELNAWNAALLGFDSGGVSELSLEPSLPGYGTNFKMSLFRQSRYEVLDALATNRYFVILRAYDFQAAWRQKKVRLLWETRFSLSERRHDFERELPAMARYASLYFGQDSHGLVRIPPIPEGRVDIGDVMSLGPVHGK
jgi:hypothetical protein